MSAQANVIRLNVSRGNSDDAENMSLVSRIEIPASQWLFFFVAPDVPRDLINSPFSKSMLISRTSEWRLAGASGRSQAEERPTKSSVSVSSGTEYQGQFHLARVVLTDSPEEFYVLG